MKRDGGGIISQHFTDLLLGEAHHFVELRGEGVVGADVEATGQIVHRDGAHARDEIALNARIGTGLYFVEESAQITFLVRFTGVTSQTFGIRKNGVCEMVVFVYKKIDVPAGTFALVIKVIQLFDSPLLFV